jgi:hypothetical protein
MINQINNSGELQAAEFVFLVFRYFSNMFRKNSCELGGERSREEYSSNVMR